MVVNACSFTLKPGEVYMVRLYCSQGGSNAALRAALMWLCWRFYCGLCGGSNAALRAVLMRFRGLS